MDERTVADIARELYSGVVYEQGSTPAQRAETLDRCAEERPIYIGGSVDGEPSWRKIEFQTAAVFHRILEVAEEVGVDPTTESVRGAIDLYRMAEGSSDLGQRVNGYAKAGYLLAKAVAQQLHDKHFDRRMNEMPEP